MEKLTCWQAKRIGLVDYLSFLGYLPQQIRNENYWYLSPLRDEKTASFKVDKRLNVWFDHGLGKGGDLIDFGTLYFKCSVAEFLSKLNDIKFDFSFHQPVASVSFAGEKKDESRIIIQETRPLASPYLLAYLAQRQIPLSVAQPVCREVIFELYGKQHCAIGFENSSGGYELRSAGFKGSSSPKDVTFYDNDSKELNVTEGFFDYLSYQALGLQGNQPLPNFLVLNSLSFFEKSRSLMEKHKQVNLFLNRDNAGTSHAKQALVWDTNRYKDRSFLYDGYKDLNDFLVSRLQKQNQRQSIRKRFRL